MARQSPLRRAWGRVSRLIHVEHTPLPPDTTAASQENTPLPPGGCSPPNSTPPNIVASQKEEGMDVLGVPLAEAELVHLINPQPSTLTLNAQMLNPEPGTINPQPGTLNSES